MFKQKGYTVLGMDCADCALHVETKVKKVDCVKEVKINFLTGKMDISYSGDNVIDGIIEKAVKDAGYSLKTENDNGKKSTQKISKILFDNLYLKVSTLFSGVFVASGIGIIHFLNSEEVGIIFLFLGIIVGGYPIALRGLKEARGLNLGINFLMSIAIIGAIIIGEYTEAGVVVFLFILAQFLESLNLEKARKSIENLIEQRPKQASVLLNGEYKLIPVEEVLCNQIVAVKPGESIPVDGLVVKGKSYVDQSTITGESAPVKLKSGDRVYAGTLNKNGFLEIQVEKEYQDTTLAKIINLVSEAQAQKAPQQAFIERFARYYTPTMVILAIAIAVLPTLIWSETFSVWFYRALVLLVISCPCALVISTPVTIISALTQAMRRGILIKGGIYLENFARIGALAFDKTGTLTVGHPSVQKVVKVNHYTDEEILTIASSIEIKSEHPIAQAILDFARSKNITLKDVTNFKAIQGKGVQGEIEGELYTLGNHKFFEEKNWCSDTIHQELAAIEDKNHTSVLVGQGNKILGIISIADAIRDSALSVVDEIKSQGIKDIALVTGDNHRTAKAVAEATGITTYFSELLPEDKVDIIKKLKQSTMGVAMVGDGINDAPALAMADIGIAMGTGGSDAALETADIALMEDNLLKLPYLKKLSNRTLKIVKQNIFIALFLKFIFLVLAIPGWATLWMAVFADMGASLIVIFNGLRLLK